MNKTLTAAVLLSTLVVSGCGYGVLRGVRTENTCGGNGYAIAGITYGDARIWVVPVTKLRPGAEFRLKLLPARQTTDPTDPGDWMVTVKGKAGGDAWIEQRSGTFNSSTRGFLDPICVPSTQAPGTYQYFIEVQNVGKLDPRARVDD